MKNDLDNAAQKAALESFVQLFNAEEFFEAHEALEQVWAARGFGDNALRALIQICAALFHVQNENHAGARSVFEKADVLLKGIPSLELRVLTDSTRSVIDGRSARFPKLDAGSAHWFGTSG